MHMLAEWHGRTEHWSTIGPTQATGHSSVPSLGHAASDAHDPSLVILGSPTPTADHRPLILLPSLH